MATSVPIGSKIAVKLYSVALFSATQAAAGFMNMLSGPMPSDGSFAKNFKGQTSAGYPIVKIGDLTKTAGDEVSCDLVNPLKGKPVMGDKRVEGQMMGLNFDTMSVRINQSRGGADTGGKMTQKRTKHNLRLVAKEGLQQWMTSLEDQVTLVHLAGGRGAQDTDDWNVPLDDDPDFADIMINPVTAPTRNRQFYAGDATAIDNIGTNDALTLQDIERLSAVLRESSVPLNPIKADDDEAYWNSPFWVLHVTERQWLYLSSRTTQTVWRQAISNAVERLGASGGARKHPLFSQMDTAMWGGILIRKMGRYAIRFVGGKSVVKYDNGTNGNFNETTGQPSVDVDRAILVGSQALLKAYGRANSDYFYDWSEEEKDHGNTVEIVAAAMNGTRKVRFKVGKKAPADTDMGVAVIDSYAPDPTTPAGLTLLAA